MVKNIKILFIFFLISSLPTVSYSEKNNNRIVEQSDPFGSLLQPNEPKIDEPLQAKIPELELATVNLKFLEAEDLQRAVSVMSSEYGSVEVNSKTNTLMICDIPEKVERIIDQIKKADQKPDQVMIEVVIIDVQLEDESEIGVNWDILSTENYDLSLRQNLSFTERLQSTNPTDENIGNATAFVTQGTGTDLAVVSGTVRNLVHAIQDKKDVEIIASPRVMVVSGDEASIESKQEIPFNEIINTSEGGELSQTGFKDVGVKLRVRATVVDNNNIQLYVNTEDKVSTGQSSAGVPIVDARVAETSLLLNDGQIVAMGGLRRKEDKKQNQQVPFFGDLPLIGFLFRANKDVTTDSELVVLLSPHIYKGEEITNAMMTKYDSIKNYSLLTEKVKEEEKESQQSNLLENSIEE